jgi:transcriptional regulator with XRE-family HTH domain
MLLHEKIKSIREDKKISQGYIAYELGVDQSQYSRREKGEIPFVPNEIVKISKLLQTSISNLFEEETYINNEGVHFGQNVSIDKKLIEQYELRIKEKEEMIALLKSQMKPL